MHLVRPSAGRMTCKFNRAEKIARMGKCLIKKLDRKIDVRSATLTRQCALAVKLCLLTGIRIGNEESAEGGLSLQGVKTYGLTTLQRTMIRIRGNSLVFKFVGKKGVNQYICIADPRLIAQVRGLLLSMPDIPTLFTVTDADVRKFVHRYVGKRFKVKDFRTCFANCIATQEIDYLLQQPVPGTKKELKERLQNLYIAVSAKLGNTPAIAKRAYVDPHRIQKVLDWYSSK